MSKLRKYNNATGQWEQLAPSMQEHNNLKNNVDSTLDKLGVLTDLETVDKSSLVNATNEVKEDLLSHSAHLASQSQSGHIQLATGAEVTNGTNNTKAVTPSTLKTELDKKANTSHTHTKDQVGLGSVENFGIATQAEAESGTANNKYMTPLLTKQAILAVGAKLERAIFRASGTFTAPKTGSYKVTVTGGGGAGGNRGGGIGAGGGAGGTSIRFVQLNKDEQVPVTIGTGGSYPSTSNSNGGNGQTSSFGTYLSATGGWGGEGWSVSLNHGGGGGNGSNGDINIIGGTGGTGSSAVGNGRGGASFFGVERTYGTGSDGNSGMNGFSGIVVIEWI